jgi:hypothetical protein
MLHHNEEITHLDMFFSNQRHFEAGLEINTVQIQEIQQVLRSNKMASIANRTTSAKRQKKYETGRL